MQSTDIKTEQRSSVTHPDQADWMGYLYNDIEPGRRAELRRHLKQCPECAARFGGWRKTMTALDQWQLPGPISAPFKWMPVLQTAAAAALVLLIGFGLGRLSSRTDQELGALRAAIDALAQPQPTAVTENTTRLLVEYSALQETQRHDDQRKLGLALQTLNARVDRLGAELQTVAVNTEDGFEQAQQNFSRLVSFSVPAESRSRIDR